MLTFQKSVSPYTKYEYTLDGQLKQVASGKIISLNDLEVSAIRLTNDFGDRVSIKKDLVIEILSGKLIPEVKTKIETEEMATKKAKAVKAPKTKKEKAPKKAKTVKVKEPKIVKVKEPKPAKVNESHSYKIGDKVKFKLYRTDKSITTEIVGFSKFHNGKTAVVVKVDGKRLNKSLSSLL